MQFGKQLKINANFVSPMFESKYLSIYKLVFSLASEKIVYTVLNQLNEVVLLRIIPNSSLFPLNDFIAKVYNEEEILKEKFESTEIILHSKRWILVPNDFFPNGGESSYLELLYKLYPQHEFYKHDKVRSLSLNVVYAEEQEIINKCGQFFQNPSFRHVICQILNQSFNICQKMNLEVIGNIEIQEGYFYYTVYKNQMLLLSNHYKYDHPEDILYYVILANHTLELDEKKLNIYLTGDSEFRDRTKELVSEHYSNFIDSKTLFPKQTDLNESGFYHDDYAYLLSK